MKAFTVAEVLVTLVVVGVISALVIPTIKLKIQEQILVSKYKQLYTMMNITFSESVKKYGPVKYWDLEAEELFMSVKFTKYIIPAGLEVENVENKLPDIPIHYLHNKNGQKNDSSRQQIYKLQNGITFFPTWIVNTKCTHRVGNYENNVYLANLCGDFSVDLNGENEPNTLGIDQYQFRVSQRGVIPVGIKDDSIRDIKDYCNPKGDKKLNGYSCGAWIIEKGTMPWLYGKQIKWD